MEQVESPDNQESSTETGMRLPIEPKNKRWAWYVLAVCLVIVIVVAWYVLNRNSQVKNQEQNVSELSSEQAGVATTIDQKILNSSLVNLSFRYPPSSNYTEQDDYTDNEIQHVGTIVRFNDSTVQYPMFEAVTQDFLESNSVSHDMVRGSLDSKDSFSVLIMDNSTMQVKELADGIYQAIGYFNLECSPSVDSYVFVRPPEGSGLKSIQFYVGSRTEGLVDSNEICSPTTDSIKDVINNLAQDESVQGKIENILALAKTFSLSDSYTASSLFYQDSETGIGFNYPLNWSVEKVDTSKFATSDPYYRQYNVSPLQGGTAIEIVRDHPGRGGFCIDTIYDFDVPYGWVMSFERRQNDSNIGGDMCSSLTPGVDSDFAYDNHRYLFTYQYTAAEEKEALANLELIMGSFRIK